MNLRILKKLSKRAVPYLERFGEKREIFPAVGGDSYTGLIIKDMSRLSRHSSSHEDIGDRCTFVKTLAPKCRQGTRFPYVKLYYSPHPIKGTPMIGWMSGYEQPEWDECTAWEVFMSYVFEGFTEYHPTTGEPTVTRTLDTPSKLFRAADELLGIDRKSLI